MPAQRAIERSHHLQVEDAATAANPNLQSSISSKIDNVSHSIVIIKFRYEKGWKIVYC